jgi:hypothetical protein
MVGFIDSYTSKVKASQMQNILTFQRAIDNFTEPILGGMFFVF